MSLRPDQLLFPWRIQQVLSDEVHLAISMAVDVPNQALFEDRNLETIELAICKPGSNQLRIAGRCLRRVLLYALQFGGVGVNWTAATLIGFAGRTDIDQVLSFAEQEPLARPPIVHSAGRDRISPVASSSHVSRTTVYQIRCPRSSPATRS